MSNNMVQWEAHKANVLLSDVYSFFTAAEHGTVTDAQIRRVQVCYSEIAAKLSSIGDAIENIVMAADYEGRE